MNDRLVDLDALVNRIGEAVKARLTNIRPTLLRSYNKIRKPLDFYLEHEGAMASELAEARPRLVSWLRPHRGISQEKLPLYLGFFEFVHSVRRRGRALLGSLLDTLLQPVACPQNPI